MGGKSAVENFDGVEIGLGDLFTNGAGNGGAVAEAVEVVGGFAVRVDADAGGYTTDVRMIGIDAAIDDGDLHAVAERAPTGAASSDTT